MSESIDIENDMDNDNEKGSVDSEKSDNVKGDKTDFVSGLGRFVSNINFKMSIFLFFLGMIIFSDIFIDKFLSNFSNAVSGECTTTKGTMIQLLFLTIGFIILDLLASGGII
jgi:hypothetical protein